MKSRNWIFSFTKEWINSLPKTINENGCWLPEDGTIIHGYVRISLDNKIYSLHRLSMCIFNDIDYDNNKIVSRHSKNCDRACFNPEHLQPGTDSDNSKDAVLHGTNFNTRKECCPKCGSEYRTKTIKSGWNKGKIVRVCEVCHILHSRNQRAKKRKV